MHGHTRDPQKVLVHAASDGPPDEPSSVVFGRVLRPAGAPIAGVEVQALHQALRSEIPLGGSGKQHTDARGSYAIRYDPPKGVRIADLVVRVVDPETDREIGRSDRFCHARRVLLVDVVVGDGPYRGYSEFQRLTRALQPHLDGASLGALTARDVEFLACVTRHDVRPLGWLADAHRLAESTDVPAAAFYAWFRQGLPTGLRGLLGQRSELLREALADAVRANVVPAALAPEIDGIVHRSKLVAARLALTVPDGEQPGPLPGLLGTTGLSSDMQSRLLARYALHEGPIGEYWCALATDPEVGPEIVTTLQLTLQLGTLAGGHVPMVEQLRARMGIDGIGSVQQLVALTAHDWLALVERSGVPPTVAGDTPAERARGYAAALRATLERAFPTPTIVAGLRHARGDDDAELLTFFDNSPGFTFTANIDRYLADNADSALDGITDVPALTRRLRRMQRLYRLAPDLDRLDAMTALKTVGIDSAQAVVRRGRESFVRSLAHALGGAAAASAVFDRAEHTASIALTLFGRYADPVIGTTPVVIHGPTTTSGSDAVTIPSWETLFGPFGACACEHCRSVYSPAAYLVDLLQFVRRQPAVEVRADGTIVTPTVAEPDGTVRDKTALDVLFERRADIGDVELTCANADTELVYVDLVNEILENAVAREAAVYQTTWTADELRANAEHLNERAYRHLAGQVYPRALPFNLWLEEARTYVGHLGVTLDELMDVLQRRGLAGLDQPALELAIAVERLALSPQGAHIVMGTPSPGREPAAYWGVGAGDWPAALFDVPTFLRHAELSHAALVELLSARFVDPDGSVVVRFATPCSTEGATIDGLTEPVLDRTHRFLRLQQAVGWTTLELDAAITAMAAPDLTPAFLSQLAQIRRLHEQLGTPIIECLSWWAPISTARVGESGDATSLYDDLFLDNAVLSPIDEALALDASRTELLGAGSETIGAHRGALLAALAITDAELSLVLEHGGLTTGDLLTLDHLSTAHRVVSLARALDLSVADFVAMCRLSGVDPSLSPAATLDVSAHARAIAASGFSIAELDYLLRHVYAGAGGLAPTDSAIALILDGIGAALAAVAAENEFVPDPTGAFTRDRLALLLAADDVQTAMAIVGGTATSSDADQGAFVDERLSAFLDVADAKRQLIGPTALVDPQARYEYVLRPLVAHLATALRTDRAVRLVADALGLDVAVAEALLTRHVATPADPARPTIDAFLAIAPDADTYGADVVDSYRLLHKIATVLARLDATADELPWLFQVGPALRWLELARLPVVRTSDAAVVAPMFDGWRRLVALYALRDRYVAGDATIFGVLDLARRGGTREAVLELLATVTGWSAGDLDFLTGAGGFDLAYPAHYRDERYLVRLEAAVTLLQRLGLSAAQVAGWRTTGSLREMREVARDIKNTVKAKYGSDAWIPIAEPVKHVLRERQRDALAACLIATHAGLADTSDLYARYLIDVSMGACMVTSRIKQAHGSVQLFVQRSLMNLEPDVGITEAGAAEWRWMKLYRVWEANRKIFLYPENWIEPELRDDKSPFFQELENELLQNAVTDAAAETALVNYLLKLGEVASLDVRAVVHEESGGTSPRDVLHVVARTHGTPHAYHYRTRVDSSYWTPWERVGVDVEGDHLLAVVWNGRLRLIWPQFTEAVTGDDSCDSLSDRVRAAFPELPTAYPWAWSEVTTWLNGTQQPLMEEILASDDPSFDDATFDIQAYIAVAFNEDIETYDGIEQVVDEWVACMTTEPRMWDIRLAWAEYRDGGWTAKQVADGVLRTGLHPKESILLKPAITGSGLLDDILVPDHPGGAAGPVATARRARDASRMVQQVDTGGELVVTCVASNTVLGAFRFTGCGGQVIVTADTNGTQTRSHLFHWSISPDDMRFVESLGRDLPLVLVSGEVDGDGDRDPLSPPRYVTALDRTPGRFNLVVPHQYDQFVAQDEFFYQDDARSFHVVPGLAAPFGAHTTVLQDATQASFDLAVQPSWPRRGTSVSPGNGGTTVATIASNGRTAADASHDKMRDALRVDAGATPLGQASDLQLDEVYRFHAFDHPHACTLLKEVDAGGTAAIMRRSIQAMSSEFFAAAYAPVESVVPAPYPLRNFDFSHAAAFAGYNWETFFHAPLLIAARLSQNQRFEEAQRWYHYVFDPTARVDGAEVTGPERYWVFHPFYLESVPQDLPALMAALNAGDPALDEQVAQWRADPFNPHLIARLRPGAYQKTVVMKYLDNLIAWGDTLFRQDTIETLNEATQLYVLAADILGRRPESLAAAETATAETYNTLADRLDSFSNALVEIENVLPARTVPQPGPIGGPASPSGGPIDVGIHLPPLPTPEMLYFCIPNNDQLLGYWDTVADRLFKIRNCMNIEGVVRQLPLYEPPIDPALLVQAAAAGVDLSSALSDLSAPLPVYRFNVMIQRAIEFCGDVRSLGAALLAALEKEDAEELALLRVTHEAEALVGVRAIRERQVEEAANGVASAERSRAMVEGRRQYYATLVDGDLSQNEFAQLQLLEEANRIGLSAQRAEQLANTLYAFPQLTASFPPESEFGGIHLGQAAQAVARWHGSTAVQKSYEASRASLTGGFDRRRAEWQFQLDSAELELAQLDVQQAAMAVRLAIAEHEMTNHDAAAARAAAVRDVMSGKYTNRELYGWMVSQIAALYSQSYQLAYDLAKRAEKAYEHEVGVVGAGFIQFGYWDSLKKGLLAGERLHGDLRRMEAAQLEKNGREYEITKHVSLAAIDPVALVKLRREGICHVQIPEALFDLDFPGHYMRRLKAVSLTIPSVAGPYAGINARLSLESSSIRVSAAATSTATGAGYSRGAPLDADERFRDEIGVAQSMVVSLGQHDHGLFEVDLDDPRYLPFERRGVIGAWTLELTSALPAFDHESISDVVFGLRYTARDGGSTLHDASLGAITEALHSMATGSGAAAPMHAVSVRHEFGDAWHRFLDPASGTGPRTLELPIDDSYFPYQFQRAGIRVTAISLYLLPAPAAESTLTAVAVSLGLANGWSASIDLTAAPRPADSHVFRPYLCAEAIVVPESSGPISLSTSDALSEQTVDDLVIAFHYERSQGS